MSRSRGVEVAPAYDALQRFNSGVQWAKMYTFSDGPTDLEPVR